MLKSLNLLSFPKKKIILVQKPFMERRTLATFLKQWPEIDKTFDRIAVTSPQIYFMDYFDSR